MDSLSTSCPRLSSLVAGIYVFLAAFSTDADCQDKPGRQRGFYHIETRSCRGGFAAQGDITAV